MFFFGFTREMGLERPLRKRAGGTFLGRGRVRSIPDTSRRDADGIEAYTVQDNLSYVDRAETSPQIFSIGQKQPYFFHTLPVFAGFGAK